MITKNVAQGMVVEQREDLHNQHFCELCQTPVKEEELYIVDGKILCPDCLETETVVCDHCGSRIWKDSNEGDDSITLCSRCRIDHYGVCTRCERIFTYDNLYYDDDDDPYCEECYESSSGIINEYSYKPKPIFYGEGNRFYGVELEIDEGGKSKTNAATLLGIGNGSSNHIYIKSDGSLNDGMEIVTHPMSLEYHQNEFPWQRIMAKADEMGYESHDCDTCGLHIHVNRNTFSNDSEEVDQCVGRVLFFVERFWDELLVFSRRTEEQLARWAARYGYKNSPNDLIKEVKAQNRNRYTCVNITNYSTIEFRIFRGTLKYSTFIATLQLVNEICNVAFSMSDEELMELSWRGFTSALDETVYPELVAYLKEKQLYIAATCERVE